MPRTTLGDDRPAEVLARFRTGDALRPELLLALEITSVVAGLPLTIEIRGISLTCEEFRKWEPLEWRDLPPRARNALKRIGFVYVQELQGASAADLRRAPNIGTKAIEQIDEMLAAHDLALAL
jgi:hypothetical protein